MNVTLKRSFEKLLFFSECCYSKWENKNTKGISWYAPYCTPSVYQQNFFIESIVPRTPIQLSYIQTSDSSNDVHQQIERNFDLAVDDGID